MHRLKKALFVGMGAISLDFAFHYFETSSMETFFYFVVKFLIAFGLAYLLFKRKGNVLVYSAIFSGIFSAYYRLTEYYSGSYFGSRVPDILLFGKPIIWSEMMLVSSLIWFAVHFLAFLIPVWLLGWKDGKS